MEAGVREGPVTALTDYVSVPIAFLVDRVVEPVRRADSDSFSLQERQLDIPYLKDYDAIAGESPLDWPSRFDVSSWRMFSAWLEDRRVGGATVAWNSPDVLLLEGRRDLALLWDIRVAPDARGRGVGSSLFRSAEAWARAQGCSELKVETQNVNALACRFYGRQGCELRSVHYSAYPQAPREIQLLWYKRLH
jgi:GNAT superfamily N-acetyltransferase